MNQIIRCILYTCSAIEGVQVEDGVEHLPHVDLPGSADSVNGDQGSDDFPLGVGQVAGVGLTHRGMLLRWCLWRTPWTDKTLRCRGITG